MSEESDKHYNPSVRICEVVRSTSSSCGFHLTRSKWDPYPWVSAVDVASAAEAAGLLPGDCVLEVNGEDVLGEKIGEVASKVRAVEDKVVLLLWNAGSDPQCNPEVIVAEG
jgi:C-terminal processing protease CtpA/Prc